MVDMKFLSTIAVVAFLGCSIANADDSAQPHRFSIIQAGHRTLLLDQTSGKTWILKEAPKLRWEEVPHKNDFQDLPTSPQKRLFESELKLAVVARTSAEPGENFLVRAVVSNPTSTPRDHIAVSFDPGEAKVTNATTNRLRQDGNGYCWEIKRLEPGKERVFEAQLSFGKEASGQSHRLGWVLNEQSGGRSVRMVRVSVNEPIVIQ